MAWDQLLGLATGVAFVTLWTVLVLRSGAGG
jgi:hypothetical protein